MNSFIPYNKPYLSGHELSYIEKAVASGKISGDGNYTKACHEYFEKHYGFRKVLLTPSCTAALEMCALLLNIQPGDEVIVPTFTFVSTVNAFVLRGASIVFADSKKDHPNLDAEKLESLITPKTKAIVVVHYAGVACDMDKIISLVQKHKIHLVEDTAQCIHSFYKGKPLGSFGTFATFSFHETKNINCGEGGMLVINDAQYIKRAEIIREKGTNRTAFARGEVNKYEWLDIGSSYLPSELNAAYLMAQLENLEKIHAHRMKLWNLYDALLNRLEQEGKIKRPIIPPDAQHNGHIYYVLCKDNLERNALLEHLKTNEIWAVFHYLCLHESPFIQSQVASCKLQVIDNQGFHNAKQFADTLLRLPLFYELKEEQIERIVITMERFYK